MILKLLFLDLNKIRLEHFYSRLSKFAFYSFTFVLRETSLNRVIISKPMKKDHYSIYVCIGF